MCVYQQVRKPRKVDEYNCMQKSLKKQACDDGLVELTSLTELKNCDLRTSLSNSICFLGRDTSSPAERHTHTPTHTCTHIEILIHNTHTEGERERGEHTLSHTTMNTQLTDCVYQHHNW